MIAAVAINRAARLATRDIAHCEQFGKEGLKLFGGKELGHAGNDE